MKSLKQKLLLRSSGREAHANTIKDSDLNANSSPVYESTHIESALTGGKAKEESRPWGLKELCPGSDPIVE